MSTSQPTNARRSCFQTELRKLGIATAAVIVVTSIVLGGLIAWSSNFGSRARAGTRGENADDAAARETVNKWLEEQRKGNSGGIYWTAGSEPAKLFAVRSWEIVDVGTWTAADAVKWIPDSTDNGGGIVTVRVDSSTQGGQQITVLWKVYLRDADWPKKAIHSVSQN